MDNIQIGRLICDKRKELGLTQQELADRLQITNKAVSKWENGDGMPDINLLSPLAAELGLTVDELLSGEEKSPCPENNVSNSGVYESPLELGGSSVSVKDAVIGIIACTVALMFAWNGFTSIFFHLTIEADILSSLPNVLLNLYNTLFWALISAVFIRKLLRIFDVDVPDKKGLAIATFVIGLPMLFIQSMDTSFLNYGVLFFITALLLSECHGYKVPHKIFYGLAILFTVCYGSAALYYKCVDFSDLSNVVDRSHIYASALKLFRALMFYILYGVFEKCCNEYER